MTGSDSSLVQQPVATGKAPVVEPFASTSSSTVTGQGGTVSSALGAQGMLAATTEGPRQLQSPVSRTSSADEDRMREKARGAQEQVSVS